MGTIFHNPVALLVLVVIIVLVFGSSKLPGAARSLGRSMRIFQSEIKGMQGESKSGGTTQQGTGGQALSGDVVNPTSQQQPAAPAPGAAPGQAQAQGEQPGTAQGEGMYPPPHDPTVRRDS